MFLVVVVACFVVVWKLEWKKWKDFQFVGRYIWDITGSTAQNGTDFWFNVPRAGPRPEIRDPNQGVKGASKTDKDKDQEATTKKTKKGKIFL